MLKNGKRLVAVAAAAVMLVAAGPTAALAAGKSGRGTSDKPGQSTNGSSRADDHKPIGNGSGRRNS